MKIITPRNVKRALSSHLAPPALYVRSRRLSLPPPEAARRKRMTPKRPWLLSSTHFGGLSGPSDDVNPPHLREQAKEGSQLIVGQRRLTKETSVLCGLVVVLRICSPWDMSEARRAFSFIGLFISPVAMHMTTSPQLTFSVRQCARCRGPLQYTDVCQSMRGSRAGTTTR